MAHTKNECHQSNKKGAYHPNYGTTTQMKDRRVVTRHQNTNTVFMWFKHWYRGHHLVYYKALRGVVQIRAPYNMEGGNNKTLNLKP